MAADVQVEFGVLGPLLVRRGAVSLPIPPGKQRAVLAALLLAANQVVSQDALIDILWDVDPPPSALVSLQNHVKRLRMSLAGFGRDRIRTERRGYLIRVLAGELDVREFEELARAGRVAAGGGDWGTAAGRFGEAVSLWRGEPLAGVCAEVLAQREVPRLAELRLQALEGRIDADLHLGRHGEVIAELRRLVAANPLRERLVGLLVLALHRDGQQAGALAIYQAARRTLLDEFGIEPGAGLQELHRQLLRAGRLWQPGAAAGEGRRPQPRHFAGRAGEVTALAGPLCTLDATARQVISASSGSLRPTGDLLGCAETKLDLRIRSVTGVGHAVEPRVHMAGIEAERPNMLVAEPRRLQRHPQCLPSHSGSPRHCWTCSADGSAWAVRRREL